jgi:hypothetical protein
MSGPQTILRGGCLCGAIRYEITAEPMLGGHSPVMPATIGLPVVMTISAGTLEPHLLERARSRRPFCGVRAARAVHG